jgi:hypothetical protein
MKKILLTVIASFLFFSCSESMKEKFNFLKEKSVDVIASDEFVQGSEDIPLLVAMEKTSDEAIGFDSNSGSIVSSSYRSDVAYMEVKNFYINTLPQMGWNVTKNLETKVVFKREKESLEIEFTQENEVNIITFFLSSAL